MLCFLGMVRQCKQVQVCGQPHQPQCHGAFVCFPALWGMIRVCMRVRSPFADESAVVCVPGFLRHAFLHTPCHLRASCCLAAIAAPTLHFLLHLLVLVVRSIIVVACWRRAIQGRGTAKLAGDAAGEVRQQELARLAAPSAAPGRGWEAG